MNALDVMAHLSAMSERAPVLVRVRPSPATDEDTLYAVHSVTEEPGEDDRLVAVITVGPVVSLR